MDREKDYPGIMSEEVQILRISVKGAPTILSLKVRNRRVRSNKKNSV